MKKIEIEWDGEKLVIDENKAFEIGERIEEIVTLSELLQMQTKPKFFKLSRCYAEMINFAGGRATPQEVHTRMMDEIKSTTDEGKTIMIGQAVSTLLEMLMDGAPEEEDPQPTEKKKSRSSKAAT
jgi:hypothetical protein